MNPVSGGPAQGIRNNFPYWEQSGIEPHIVSLDTPNLEFDDKIDIVKLGTKANKWYYSSKLIPWLVENMPFYDVILVHGLWQYNGYAVYKAIKQLIKDGKRIPKVFVMTHGMLDPYFQKSKERRLKALRNSIYWHLIEKKLINSVDGILFTCDEELQLAKTTFNNYHPKAEFNIGYGVVQPPVNSHLLKNAFEERCAWVEGMRYFLFISRIHPKKGVDLLIKAYQRLKANSSLDLPKLIIAGPSLDTNYGKKMLELASNDDDIIFPGMLEGDAKWGAFYNAEVFILPSHQENFGIAVAESLACSKPVIITNKVNIWREIEGMNGGIVTNDDLDGVVEGLTKWVELPESQRTIMRENAFNTYKQYFTSEATSKKFIDVIKK
jgi:glycosyltransferase involved in cell wall biosynthesis